MDGCGPEEGQEDGELLNQGAMRLAGSQHFPSRIARPLPAALPF